MQIQICGADGSTTGASWDVPTYVTAQVNSCRPGHSSACCDSLRTLRLPSAWPHQMRACAQTSMQGTGEPTACPECLPEPSSLTTSLPLTGSYHHTCRQEQDEVNFQSCAGLLSLLQAFDAQIFGLLLMLCSQTADEPHLTA